MFHQMDYLFILDFVTTTLQISAYCNVDIAISSYCNVDHNNVTNFLKKTKQRYKSKLFYNKIKLQIKDLSTN